MATGLGKLECVGSRARGLRGVRVEKPDERHTEAKSLLRATQLITNWVGT